MIHLVLVKDQEIFTKSIDTFQEQIDLCNDALATHEKGKLCPESVQVMSDGDIF